MRKQRTDGLIYILLVLATAAAILSSPQQFGGAIRQFGWLMIAASVPDAAIAAGALGDVRYFEVPP
jgi:hypothetical protein